MLIDCDNCTVRPHACAECVVSVLLGPPGDAVLDAEERDAVEVLAASGLVPPLRLAPGPAREGRPARRPARRAAG